MVIQLKYDRRRDFNKESKCSSLPPSTYIHDLPGPPSPPPALSFRLDLETDTGTQSTSEAARIFHTPNPTGRHQPVT